MALSTGLAQCLYICIFSFFLPFLRQKFKKSLLTLYREFLFQFEFEFQYIQGKLYNIKVLIYEMDIKSRVL